MYPFIPFVTSWSTTEWSWIKISLHLYLFIPRLSVTPATSHSQALIFFFSWSFHDIDVGSSSADIWKTEVQVKCRWSVLGSPSVASSQRWSQNQRIVWVERNLKDLPIPTPRHEHRHLPLDQVAQTFPLEHQEGTACLAGRKETPAWILDLQPKVQRWPCL